MDTERVLRHLRWAGHLRSLVLVLILLPSWLMSAGTPAAQNVAPDCTAADLDISYQFINKTPTEQVAVNLRNISQRPCTLESGAGVGFGDARHGHTIWTKTCENCGGVGQPRLVPPVTVAVGAAAHLVVSWETTAVDGTSSCQEGGMLNSYVNRDTAHVFSIWAGSLLGDVCSVVRVDAYLPGAFGEQDKIPVGSAGRKDAPVTITLTPSSEIAYPQDSFWLYADIRERDEVLLLNAYSPELFLHTRASDGATSFFKIGGECRVVPAAQKSGRSIRCEVAPMWFTALMKPGESRVELCVVSGSPHAPRVEIIRSNALTLHIADPAAVQRRWGPEAEGLAVSLFLDKDTYAIGEDIPLRVAVENFSADASVATGELPCAAGLTFDVRDSKGEMVQSPGFSICGGHGWLQRYPKGTTMPVLGFTLRGLGHLPDRAGDYTVTATWNARRERNQEQLPGQPMIFFPTSEAPLLPYAVVHSAPATFHVVTPAY